MTRLGITEWHWQQGEVREAKRHAQVAYEIDPTSARSAILAGMIAHVEGDYESAEKYFQDAQLAAPDDFNARNHLVMVLAAQDDPAKNERALKLAETNRRDFPNNPIAIATLGWTQLQTGDTTEAGKSLQLAASSRQLTADTAYFLAKFMADRGDKEQARKALKQVLDTRPLFVYRKAAEKLNDKIK